MEKYSDMALELGAASARLITPEQVFFDRRVILKCRWGCEYFGREEHPACGRRGLGYEDCVATVRASRHILLVHGHDARRVSQIVLEIERRAFLDGLYLACAVRKCKLCPTCLINLGQDCAHPEKVRPCDQALGIDMYRTANALGLPCYPLQSPEDQQNRYGLVLLD